ncbi:hypothetical protein ATERTT37_001949 [Aspergillus terreus]
MTIQDSLSDDVLLPLKSYKYSSVDKSFISRYILKHYETLSNVDLTWFRASQWNAFVEVLPMWLAPNMVTLLGFFFIIGNVILIELLMPDLIGPSPDDANPESHGIDSLNCTMASLLETAAMGFGSTQLGAYTALVPCLAMYFSTWETYHTHTLYLGYINGPTEGLLVAIGIMIASGIYGPQIWSRPIVEFLNYPQIFGNNSVKDLWIPFLLLSFFIGHLPGCVLNVIEARRKQNLPVLPIFKEWVPMIVFTASNIAWLFSPYSTILAEGRLVLYCWAITFVFGRMTTKIILAHLLRQPFPYWTVLQTPLIGGAILANLPRFGLPMVSGWFEVLYLRAYLLFAFVAYMHWAFLVINRITTFLGINCLTIRRDKSVARDQAYLNFGERTESPSGDPTKRGLKSH